MFTIMIGPSGAGKSTWIKNNINPQHVVSSDQIREDLFGDFRSQQDNNRVFRVLHSVVSTRLLNKLPTCIDATNLNKRDRKVCLEDALYAAFPFNKIRYVVVNRPVSEKLITAGWRNEVPGLIEKHEATFQRELQNILSADGHKEIEVIDARTY